MLHILSVRGHYYMMFVCSCICRCDCLGWLSLVPTLKCEHLRVWWLILSFLFKPLFLSQKVFTMFMMALNITRLEISPRLIFRGVASVQVFIYLCISDLFIAVKTLWKQSFFEVDSISRLERKSTVAGSMATGMTKECQLIAHIHFLKMQA